LREVLFGLIGGTLIGATGIGSGSLLTPLLIMAGYRPSVAVSTGLATLVVSKLTGSIAHHSRGNWPGRQGWIVVCGGVLGVAIIAIAARGGLSPSELFVRRAVAISLFASSIAVWIRSKPAAGASETPSDARALFLSGAIVGGFVTLTSAGSGSLLVPLLLTITAWGVPQLAATSNAFGWVIALLSFALHVSMRTFDPHLFLLVLAGLVPGVIGGVALSPSIDRRSFTPALSLFTLYLGIQLI
jgi:uncharacterized membrane protein YfcA